MEETAKRARIAAVRDDALRILWQRGCWNDAVDNKPLSADVGQCRIAYRRPFQMEPEPSEELQQWSARVGWKIDHEYGLDIWFCRKKVLIIVWDECVPFDIIWYEPGEWEGVLSGAALQANPVRDLDASDGE